MVKRGYGQVVQMEAQEGPEEASLVELLDFR